MEIYILFLLAFIGVTAFFIFKAYHWLSEQKVCYEPFCYPIPQPIIRTYNMEEIAYSFIYSTPAMMRHYYNVGLEDRPKIFDKDALEYEKKRCAERIGRKMLEDGFIEVKERPHLHNPYMNEVNLLARVYRDGAVSQKENI